MGRPGMVKKKPAWLTLLDFLTIALPGVLILASVPVLLAVGAEGPSGWPLLTALVGLCFVGIWVRVVLSRKSYLAEFRWYPAYGIMAHPGEGYVLPDDMTMDNSVRETMNRWTIYYGPRVQAAVASDVIWVFFKKGLNESAANRARKKVKGITFARSHTMQVDFDTPGDPLEKTAFEHELGHIIYGFATGDWDEAAQHTFIRGHGLR